MSIFFNPSARTAIFEVQQLNRDIQRTSTALATGRRINSSADDPNGYAQIQRLRSSVAGYEVSRTNVQSGRETVSVARQGADQAVSVLQSMKETITAANGAGADYNALVAELDALRLQYQGIIDTSQLSGVSLLQGGSNFDVTSGVYTDANGAVQTSVLSTASQDLRIADTFGAGSAVANLSVAGNGAAVADSAAVTVDYSATGFAAAAGQSYRFTIDGEVFEYVAASGEAEDDIFAGITQMLKDGSSARGLGVAVVHDTGADTVTITNNSGAAMEIEVATTTGGSTSGSLRGVRDLSVSDATNAATALSNIDTLIDAAIDSATRLGASEGRFDTQENFLDQLIFSAEGGISRIGDADVAEESIRLSNLQSQYDLALSALALSNETQNAVLRLFV
ncbi:MAG: flagellin [Pseudomonadota bacterium]